jgi:hypothetical protein
MNRSFFEHTVYPKSVSKRIGAAAVFCTIRSYAATMQKQGANIFDCLALVFQGKTPEPRLT